jgi:hypothetical protein
MVPWGGGSFLQKDLCRPYNFEFRLHIFGGSIPGRGQARMNSAAMRTNNTVTYQLTNIQTNKQTNKQTPCNIPS